MRLTPKVWLIFCTVVSVWPLLLTAQTATPVVKQLGVVNGASFRPQGGVITVARGSIVSIFGSGLSRTTVVADRLPLPIKLPGTETQVFFNHLAAPLLYVSESQINAQVPFELPDDVSVAGMVVLNGTQASTGVPISLVPADPGIFSVLQTGRGPSAVVHPDGTLVSPAHPVRPGGALTLYATGLGAVTPPTPSGYPALNSPLSIVNLAPAVKLAGRSVPVTFAGLAPYFVGLYQINIQVPADFTEPTPEIVVQQGNATAPVVSAGGSGLLSIEPATAATGSANVSLVAKGLNFTKNSLLNFGGRKLLGVVQNGLLDTLTVALSVSALRAAAAIPVFITGSDTGSTQSNALTFAVTGPTVPGSAPAISSVTVMAGQQQAGGLASFSASLDFKDVDGDIVHNGAAESSAKLEIDAIICKTTIASPALNVPDQVSGRIQFSFTIPARQLVMTTFVMVTLIDQSGNRSNAVAASPGLWYCP